MCCRLTRAPPAAWLADDKDEEEQPVAATPAAATLSPLVVALHRVHDPQNLGAVLRSAFYFGASMVVLSEPQVGGRFLFAAPSSHVGQGGTLTRITPAVSSASAGAAEFVEVRKAVAFEQLLREAGAGGWAVVGTSLRAEDARHVPHHRVGRALAGRGAVLVRRHLLAASPFDRPRRCWATSTTGCRTLWMRAATWSRPLRRCVGRHPLTVGPAMFIALLAHQKTAKGTTWTRSTCRWQQASS